MESLDYHQIRDYCRTAVDMAEELGAYDGLSFLIGEKFYSLILALKQAEAKVEFLYNAGETGEDEAVESPLSGNTEIHQGYLLAIQNNYQKALEKIEDLSHLRNDFVEEIKEAFELDDIREYLESYPRFGGNESELGISLKEDDQPIEYKDVMSEIDDIFLVEEIKKLFY
ncbi:hypothetical protein ACTRW9_13365 [Nitrospina sp. 32_T5]|uniref:hypothetical protein n=1 Tax=unclassified Nitrospina TaxID=2638683 RepID=UPI003F95BA72